MSFIKVIFCIDTYFTNDKIQKWIKIQNIRL